MKLRVLLFVAAVMGLPSLYGQSNSGSIDVPEGVRSLLKVKGDGVQIYSCTKVENGQKWVLKGPDAKLLDARGHVIGAHSPGPTWKLNDGGVVQGELIASRLNAHSNSVPWLLLRAKPGTAGGSLGSVTFIRRTKTHGGVAPKTGCQEASEVDREARVPYTATYTFYTPK